jgi:glycosyltransferase involved in cell wall biosynthesis
MPALPRVEPVTNQPAMAGQPRVFQGLRITVVGPSAPRADLLAHQTSLLCYLLAHDGAHLLPVDTNVRAVAEDRILGRWLLPLFQAMVVPGRLLGAIRRSDLVHVEAGDGWDFFLPALPAFVLGKVGRRQVTLLYTGSGTQAFLQRWQRLARPILRRLDGFAVTSERLRAEFQRYGLEPSIIPVSIEVERFPFSGHPEWPPLILWMNSLEPGSNPAMALRALAVLRQSMPEARLLMVGRGHAAAEVKSLAAELDVAGSVAYRPSLPFSRLRRVMQTASVAWNTNSVDSFPVSVLEAAASGTVVVSTEVGGIEEFLHDGVDALLVPVDDHEALAAATLQALRRPILSDGLAHNARLAVQGCDWEQTRGKLARLFGWRAGLSPWLEEGEEAEPPPAGVGSLELETMGLRGRAEFLRTQEPPTRVDLPAEEVPAARR